MTSPGEEGLELFDKLYGRCEPIARPETWACAECNTPQLNRLPHIVDGKPVCATCFWRAHEEASG